MKLYTGEEWLKLAKKEYYICKNRKFNESQWKNEIINKLYPLEEYQYGNDAIGVKIKVMSHYIYCRKYMESFNFEIFINTMNLDIYIK